MSISTSICVLSGCDCIVSVTVMVQSRVGSLLQCCVDVHHDGDVDSNYHDSKVQWRSECGTVLFVAIITLAALNTAVIVA